MIRRSLALVLLLCVAAPSVWGARKKSPPCVLNLVDCPAIGCATPKGGDAVLNRLKRHTPNNATPIQLTLNDFGELQDQADTVVGEKRTLSREARNQLQHLTTSGGEVGEGTLVQVTGYLVGTPHANSGESVNCRLPRVANNDLHLTIAPEAGLEEFDGIVVEIIPQAPQRQVPTGRKEAPWTTKKLKAVEALELRVLVRGQLLYDNKHFVNDDPEQPRNGDPKRFSLWEIHPVSAFLVCKDEPCDSKNDAMWTPLETFQP